MVASSSDHLKLVYRTWRWVHYSQMFSTVTRSQSNRPCFGCGEMENLHHGCAADTYAATICEYGPKCLKNISYSLLNSCHEEVRHSRRQKKVQHNTARCATASPILWMPYMCCTCSCQVILAVLNYSIKGMRCNLVMWTHFPTITNLTDCVWKCYLNVVFSYETAKKQNKKNNNNKHTTSATSKILKL